MVAGRLSVCFGIASRHGGALVGPGGENIRKLQAEVGTASILVSKAGERTDGKCAVTISDTSVPAVVKGLLRRCGT